MEPRTLYILNEMTNGSQLSVSNAVSEEIKHGLYSINGLLFPVRVLDARKVWGRVDVLISPLGGSGETWVESSKVKF